MHTLRKVNSEHYTQRWFTVCCLLLNKLQMTVENNYIKVISSPGHVLDLGNPQGHSLQYLTLTLRFISM